MDIDISHGARRRVEAFLASRFGMTAPVKLSAATGGRSNKDTHLVATDRNDERASLKYVSGHYSDRETQEHLLPTENIAVAGQLSLLLETPAPMVEEVLESVDDHTRTFLEGHACASLTPDEFVRAVLEGL